MLTIAADVADAAAMRAAISAAADARFGGIDGVIHAAGVAGGAFIERQDLATSAAVFAPKVDRHQGALRAVQRARARLLRAVLLAALDSAGARPHRLLRRQAYLDAVAAGHSGKASLAHHLDRLGELARARMGAIDQRPAAANPLLQKAWESSAGQ